MLDQRAQLCSDWIIYATVSRCQKMPISISSPSSTFSNVYILSFVSAWGDMLICLYVSYACIYVAVTYVVFLQFYKSLGEKLRNIIWRAVEALPNSGLLRQLTC